MADTSIRITKETQTRLRKKRGAMEAQTGEEVTFDDVINKLLDQDKRKRR